MLVEPFILTQSGINLFTTSSTFPTSPVLQNLCKADSRPHPLNPKRGQ